MAAVPATRYLKSDDAHIAYQVTGDGPLSVKDADPQAVRYPGGYHTGQLARVAGRSLA